MRVLRHTPNYVDRKPESGDNVEVATLHEALALPYIRDWTYHPLFANWSRSSLFADRSLLIAMLKDGSYRVVAYVAGGDISSLPDWRDSLSSNHHSRDAV